MVVSRRVDAAKDRRDRYVQWVDSLARLSRLIVSCVCRHGTPRSKRLKQFSVPPSLFYCFFFLAHSCFAYRGKDNEKEDRWVTGGVRSGRQRQADAYRVTLEKDKQCKFGLHKVHWYLSQLSQRLILDQLDLRLPPTTDRILI